MIKGSTQGFKFTTPYDFNDINNIVAVFSQTNNVGTTSAPMPITKYYNKSVTELDRWDESAATQGTTYYVGTKYYRYGYESWIPSDDQPTEEDIGVLLMNEYPFNYAGRDKVYKCDKSYYQYDPDEEKWVLTTTEPSMNPTRILAPGIEKIEEYVDKKRPCVYKQQYYKCSTEFVNIDVWDENSAERDTIYYVKDTNEYYFFDSGWHDTNDISAAGDNFVVVETWSATGVDVNKVYYVKNTETYHYYKDETWKSTKIIDEASNNCVSVDSFDDFYHNRDSTKIYYIKDNKTFWFYVNKWIPVDNPVTYGLFDWSQADTIQEIHPIQTIEYWGKVGPTQGEVYCASETYYKCIDDVWYTYGSSVTDIVDIYAWDDDVIEHLDKSKIYVLKEYSYGHNKETGDFEKVAAKEVYYKYCKKESGVWDWIEIDDPTSLPKIEAVDAGVWLEDGDYDENTTYVCRDVYYSYNEKTGKWEGSDTFVLSAIEVSQWDPKNTEYDITKIYTSPTRYYQYSIEEGHWKEVDKIEQPKIEALDYWHDADKRDKNKIYLCGTTYFQYDSSKSEWVPSDKFKLQIVEGFSHQNSYPDESKIYKCDPTYYSYEDGAWKTYNKPVDVAKNDGFSPVNGEPKSFIVALTAEETMRFNDKYKGCVQVDVYCLNTNSEAKNKITYFPVYPTMIKDVFNYGPSEIDGSIVIFDAGKII